MWKFATGLTYSLRSRLWARGYVVMPIVLCLGLLLGDLPRAGADEVATIAASALEQEMHSPNPPLLLDVRTDEEFAQGHIPGALNIPHKEIETELGRLAGYQNRDVVVYCKSGVRAKIALDLLKSRGFTRLWHLSGDYTEWVSQGRAVEVVEATVPH